MERERETKRGETWREKEIERRGETWRWRERQRVGAARVREGDKEGEGARLGEDQRHKVGERARH